MRVIEAAVAALVTAALLTFLVHRLHGNVDLVVLWVVTFLVMFVTVIVLPYSSRDRR
jgi:hypothetical protein